MSSLTNIRVISQVGFGFIDGCAVTLRSRLFFSRVIAVGARLQSPRL